MLRITQRQGVLVRLTAAGLVCLSVLGLSFAAESWAAVKRPTHVEAQPLGPALKVLAKEHGFQVLYRTELVGDLHVRALNGEFTTDEALHELLSGTGLTYRYLGERAVTIVPVTMGATSGAATPGTSEPQEPAAEGTTQPDRSSNAGGSFWDKFRLAQVDQGQAASAAPVAQNQQGSKQQPVQLEEIIVTAQKRDERLIDTPQSVSVLSSDDLNRLAATQFRDFANTVPGLNYQTAGAGNTDITLRGVTTGFDVSPTVAVYVDEVPYGSSTAFGGFAQLSLDVGLFDLARIEVLRGPQGTLYGASTMGGLIKYVTKKPDTTSFGGGVQAGASGTQHGGGSYDVAAAANIPIVTDKVAVRVSGFESHDGGFIDNLAHSDNRINRGDIYGGRVDLLYTPADPLTIRITGFLQNTSRDGEATADYTFAGVKPYGSLGQYRLFAEPFDQRFRLTSGTVAYDFGAVTLTSVSSYQDLRSNQFWDISEVYVPLLNGFGFGPFSAVGSTNDARTNKFTQEVRLAAEKGHALNWIIGGFYTHENTSNSEVFSLRDLAGQPAPNNLYSDSSPSTYREYAAFADLTWHLTDKFSATGGLRYAHNDQQYTQLASGLFIGSRPTASSREHAVTHLANALYQISDHATAYLRYATGYRPGGPNFSANDPVTGLPLGPTAFESDKLKSYEGGFKAESADRRFGLDVAGYYIDWSNIQIQGIRGGFGFKLNAPGGATVQGAELTLAARPISSFTMTGAFAYQHAYLKEADADLGAAHGERLPNVPRFTTSLNTDYLVAEGGLRPTIGATLRYVDARWASFDKSTSFPQYHLPDYTTVDLRGGLVLNSATVHPVDVQLYVHNLFDERSQVSIIYPQFGARVAIAQPRTVGVTVSTKF